MYAPPAQPGAVWDSPVYVALPPTNRLAVVAFVFSLLGGGIFSVPLGHIALSQIKQRGQRGSSFAIIALVLGYPVAVIFLLSFIFGLIIGFGEVATDLITTGI